MLSMRTHDDMYVRHGLGVRVPRCRLCWSQQPILCSRDQFSCTPPRLHALPLRISRPPRRGETAAAEALPLPHQGWPNSSHCSFASIEKFPSSSRWTCRHLQNLSTYPILTTWPKPPRGVAILPTLQQQVVPSKPGNCRQGNSRLRLS